MGRRACEQQVGVADGVQRRGAAEGAANLIAADRFANVMHDDQRRLGGIAQPQQALTQRRHRARIVFVLVVGGVQRVEHDHLGGGLMRGIEKVTQSLRRTEQMADRRACPPAGSDRRRLLRIGASPPDAQQTAA